MRIFILFVLTCLAYNLAFAVGNIVFDPTTAERVVEQTEQIDKELGQLRQQLTQLKDTYNQTKSIAQDATGHYGFGSLLNQGSSWTNREWTSSSWSEALQGLSGGNRERYNQLQAEYAKDHPTITQSEYQQGSSQAQAQNYAQNVATNKTAMTQSSYEYDQLNQITQQLQQLSTQIEGANNKDTKSAIDLNSRLLEAVANIQLEELKMQTLQNEQMAQGHASNISYDTQAAQFNTIPDPKS